MTLTILLDADALVSIEDLARVLSAYPGDPDDAVYIHEGALVVNTPEPCTTCEADDGY